MQLDDKNILLLLSNDLGLLRS